MKIIIDNQKWTGCVRFTRNTVLLAGKIWRGGREPRPALFLPT